MVLTALAGLTAGTLQAASQERERGVSLLQAGRYSDAIAALEAALTRDPSDTAARFHLGRAFIAAGEPVRAVEQLELALVGSADPSAVHFQLGSAWLAQENWMAAWRELSQAVELRPTHRVASYVLGEICYRVGEVDAASTRFAALAEVTPRWPDPEVRAAELAMERNEVASTVAWLERAIMVSPERPGLWTRLGDAHSAAFDYKAAELAYRKATELSPGILAPRLALAYHFFNVQQFDLAEVELGRALALAPGDPSVLLPYAETLLYLARGEAALAAVDAALGALEPASGDGDGRATLRAGALELQARILVKLGQLEAAETAARALLVAVPRSVQGHFALGTVLQRRGDPAAAEHLRAFKRLSDGREHRELGDEYLRLAGDGVAAEREYRLALEIDPSDVVARVGLGRALLVAGDPADALATLEPLASQGRGNVQWLTTWILSLDASGRHAEAIAAWEIARRDGVEFGPEVWAITRRAAGVCDATSPNSPRQ
jgi:tetratricopeptide (TPR) repeat protein